MISDFARGAATAGDASAAVAVLGLSEFRPSPINPEYPTCNKWRREADRMKSTGVVARRGGMGEIRSTKTRREKWREQDSSHRSLLGAQPCRKHLNRENPILRVVRDEGSVCAAYVRWGRPVCQFTVGCVKRSETHNVRLYRNVVRCTPLHAPYRNRRFTSCQPCYPLARTFIRKRHGQLNPRNGLTHHH